MSIKWITKIFNGFSLKDLTMYPSCNIKQIVDTERHLITIWDEYS